jgi:sensor histidine kinase regulating citrate/malate metabolism
LTDSCITISASAPGAGQRNSADAGLADKVAARDITGIARLIQPLRAESDASYIVIGDTREQHLYHSESPERLNLPMIGGDNAEVLKGKPLFPCVKGDWCFITQQSPDL